MAIFVLVGFVALSIDAGYVMSERRHAQAASDAAALAGAEAYQQNLTASIVNTGTGYAAANGFSGGLGDTVTITPMATYQSFGRCVRATIDHPVDPFFVSAVYTGAWGVSATGVACADVLPQNYALIALDENGKGIYGGGNSTVTITNGGVMSNADIDLCGTTSWIHDGDPQGPLDSNNGAKICNNANVDVGSQDDSAAIIIDPLATVPEPTAAECNTAAPIADPDIRNQSPAVTILKPGYYPNGITISGQNKTILFESGEYCLGDDLTVASGSSGNMLYGWEVLFFFDGNGATFNMDGGGSNAVLSVDPITAERVTEITAIAGGVTGFDINLLGGGCTAPACVADILIFYSRGDCANNRTFTLVGGVKTDIRGIIYTPCSKVKLGGGSGSTFTGQVFGSEIQIAGGSQMRLIYHAYVQLYAPKVFLVE